MPEIPQDPIDSGKGVGREVGHWRSRLVQHGEIDGCSIDVVTQVVIHDGPGGRVLPLEHHVTEVGFFLLVADHRRRLDREQVRRRREDVVRHLLQRVDLVENPDPATVRAEDEVVVPRMDDEVVERHGREIEAQPTPVGSPVPGVEQPELGSDEQHLRIAGVLPRGAEHSIGGQVADDGGPRLAVVARPVQVVRKIVVPVVVDRDVHRSLVVAGRFDARDPRHLREPRHAVRHVGPGPPVVERDLDVPVVGADIQHARPQRRFGDRGERGEIGDAVVERERRVVGPLAHDQEVPSIDPGRELPERRPRVPLVDTLPELVRSWRTASGGRAGR